MGSGVSKTRKRSLPAEERCCHGLLSNLGIFSITSPLPTDLVPQPMVLGSVPPVPEHFSPSPERSDREAPTLPGFISIFLPEFPRRKFPGQDHFQILGFIAKGSFGPILKVKDITKEKTYAVKVLSKSAILKHGVIKQSKEEVIIQRQVKHPFLHNLQDCWQTQRHLFIMCDFCSSGDLYTYWLLKGHFGEDELRVFSAELGCALGFLHDFGIMHRDVKMENILLTDQAPEVLSGGPYNHSADWWSLGIMLFSLVTGKFPVPPEPDHCNMLSRVQDFSYPMPQSLSPPLALLLTELLCKNPSHRLRSLERFKRQTFFRGTSFDSQLLQKTPVELILELRNHPDHSAKALRGLSMDYFHNFECDVLNSPTSASDLSPTLANMDLSPATVQGCNT